jgi:hypothetical protein
VGGLDTSPIDPYSSGTKYFLDPYVIFKVQTGLTERKGITKSIRYSPTAIAQYDTIKNLAYAKLSSTSFNDGVIFWDGITATPSQ